MLKRLFFFFLTNILVLVTISIVLNVLGVKPYITAQGIDYQSLMIFCLVWGMGGALISLAMSRFMAKMMLGVKVIDPNNPGQYRWLHDMVAQHARQAGLPNVPEVGVYSSPEANAFATGPMKSRSLVAFSSGILASMNADQLSGVAAHEISHIANGDMVTMTLLQGIMNAFVMFLSRIIAFAASQSVKEENRYVVNMLVTVVLEILLSILGMIVVFWFSRQREYRADAGAARLAGRERMISALELLGRARLLPQQPASLATLKISGKTGGFMALFASHPPLEERIARLQSGAF